MNMPMQIDGAGLFDSEKPPADNSDTLRKALYWAGGLLALLLVLAAVVPIGGAVIGSGQVGVASRVKKIAHPTGGVIQEVLVSNGEHVEKGQLLMKLDDRVSGADASYSSLTVEQLLAQRARLDAERLGMNSISFPAELTGAGSETAQKAMNDEAQLFAIRRTEQAQLAAQLRDRMNQYNQSIRGIGAQIGSLQTQRKLIEPERQNVRDLWDKQLVTIGRLNELERSAVNLEGNIATQQSQIAEMRARISETQEQLIQLGQTRRVQAGEELARINTILNDQQLRSVSASDQKSRTEIRAPYSGTIEKIAFNAIGEVVRPAEAIMEIVPDSDNMVVETMVNITDIDQVTKGQSARVRFSAFNLQTTPEIAGKVTYVATDRTEKPETGMTFFMVRVEVEQGALRREKMSLRSGMPAEVYIETGNRSLMSYVTKPLRDQFARAFKDN
jgi:HlyD family type I secretion membrane fusion protein